MEHIGILHPGEMGISLAHAALMGGHHLYWCSEERSERTRRRAESQGLVELGELRALCERCDILISICPPHAAEPLAGEVIRNGFRGPFLDANAISPRRMQRIADAMQTAGIECVDGGVIGGPAWQPGETCLYLAGPAAQRIAACFANSPLETRIIAAEAGAASALKMCYAAYSKGSTALLCGVLAAAESLGVRSELAKQWERDEAGSAEKANSRVRHVTAKAWRFEGEMHEIAETFEASGVPGGFHEAAAELYRRMATFKGAAETPQLEPVLGSLLKKKGAA